MEFETILSLCSVILLLSWLIPCGKSRPDKSKSEAQEHSKSKTSKSSSTSKKRKSKKNKKQRYRKVRENGKDDKDGKALDKTQIETVLRTGKQDEKDGAKLGEAKTQMPEDNKEKRKDDTSQADEDGPYEDVNMTESKAQRTKQKLVTVDPLSSKFQTIGGSSKHNILNVGSKRIVFKIKCSNTDEYRIEPVFGFVEAVASAEVRVLRMPGNPKEDKFVIYYLTVASETKDPEAAYKEAEAAGTTAVQTITVPLKTEGPPLKTIETDHSRTTNDPISKAVEKAALGVAATQGSHREPPTESASDASSARLEKTQE